MAGYLLSVVSEILRIAGDVAQLLGRIPVERRDEIVRKLSLRCRCWPRSTNCRRRRGKGFFSEVPETIHEKAVHLMRLLVADHPFVDGNKRTALRTVVVFYVLNGYTFDYSDEIRALLPLRD